VSKLGITGDPIVRPRRLRLEASSACQLKCPDCPTATGDTRPVLGVGHLRFDSFRKLLDRNPSLLHVELSNYGELFLNPELPKIMEHAFACGVQLTADNGANLNTVREETLEALVKFRFRRITYSIDGASAETYARYRVGGDFETVIANIRKIQEHKVRRGSPYPRLAWQFISFPHNQHEIETARKLARHLDMQFCLKLPWKDDADDELVQINQKREPASRSEYSKRYGVNYMRPICRQLWRIPQVNWDGRVLGCCRNFWGEFGGNAFEDGIESITNSERMRYARAMLLGTRQSREDIPCATCDLYLQMKETGR
jgi:MoaA/NifB/PqqE/SkfB family radical SAM enzyme